MRHAHHTLACATMLSNDFWSMLSAIIVGSVAAASFTSEARRSFNAPSFASELVFAARGGGRQTYQETMENSVCMQ